MTNTSVRSTALLTVFPQVTQHDDSYRSHYCSYLQMRASIPTYWYQETSVTMPKPPILVNRVDPDYRATEVREVAELTDVNGLFRAS